MPTYITSFFQNIKFLDIVDIGVITIFIYLVLVWLKKARARFIFIGMIILGLVYGLARVLGLYFTTIALEAFFAVALIIIVIIFQDDLRHFFEKLGVFRVRRTYRSASSFAANVEILSSALANLVRKKIGALIVIKGLDPLDRHLEAGIAVDGLISQVLLESIFDKHVPSHDGAVVIEGDRLTKLGCHLPLSTNIKEIGRLGTRHAAGVGISERADALSLIVSEEEGTISASEGGKIKNLKEVAQLNNIIQDFYRKKFPEKRGAGLPNFLTSHYLEVILAVAVAFTLWAAFGQRTGIVRRDFIVPVEYRNLAQDRVIKEPKVKDVGVTLSGTERGFNLLKPEELRLSLDTSGIGDGENRIALTKEMIRNSSGLSVVGIEPSEVSLNLYRLIRVTVPVELKTKGHPPYGFVLRDIRVDPPSITVMVSSVVPKDKIRIATEQVDLTSIRETTTIIPKLIVSPEIQFLEDKFPEIKAVIEVEKRKEGE